MRFAAVAVDYDGTLAHEGVVSPETVQAVKEFVASGRKFFLVTGRILHDLLAVFPEAALCARIVAENGAVLYNPATGSRQVLASPPPRAFIDALIRKHVQPLEVGESIIGTVRPHEVPALEAIRDLGLEHHLIFNRESVMILPSGVNKASGLTVALKDLALSPHNVVAVGDSENDHALMDAAEWSVAVRNAIPSLRDRADIVTSGEAGAGVSEILRALVSDDLQSLVSGKPVRSFPVGLSEGAGPLTVPCQGHNILLAGSPEDTMPVFRVMMDALANRQYQWCVIDSQGLPDSVPGVVKFGTALKAPAMAEIMNALDNPESQVVVNLVGRPLAQRVALADQLLHQLQQRQDRTGRPHRIFINDSDALLTDKFPFGASGRQPAGVVCSAAYPARLAVPILRAVDAAIAVGGGAGERLEAFAGRVGLTWAHGSGSDLRADEGWLWQSGEGPQRIRLDLRPQDPASSSARE